MPPDASAATQVSAPARDVAPPAPRFGSASIADVAASVLDAFGGATNPLGVPPADRIVILLVDGLGFEQLRDHAALAPFLDAAVQDDPIDATYPTTTATSLASLTTGLAPGRHGLLGATVAIEDSDRPMSLLKWRLHGVGPTVDLTDRHVPEHVQPLATLPERAARRGLNPVIVGPIAHAGSGLNRALLRGATMRPAEEPADLIDATHAALSEHSRRLVYTYHGRLDAAGHHEGVDSDAWREQLETVDALVAGLAKGLPPGTVLVVTADHGMVDLVPSQLIDSDRVDGLLDGVRVLAGEPRFRHVHALPGASQEVVGRWRHRFADEAWVLSRDEAVHAGWFGEVEDRVRSRIGDVVVAAGPGLGIVQKTVDPRQVDLRGHHGSVTTAERHVPLAILRP